MFHEADRSSTGVCSYSTFRKIVSNTGFWLNEAQFARLTEPFHVSPSDFRYRDFLDAEGTPAPAQTNDDLAQFALNLRARGIDLGDLLSMYDSLHIGHVSAATFVRALGNTPLIMRIAKQCEHPSTHDINYIQLNNELKRLLSAKAKPAVPQVEPAIPTCFATLAVSIRDQRIDYRGRLVSLDRLKRKRIGRREFVLELGVYRSPITPQQKEEIATAFADSNGEVDYERFADELDAAIANAPKTAKPTEGADLQKALEYLRETARDRHSQIASVLRSFDPHKTGAIPSGRFARSLEAEAFKLSLPEVDLLKQEFGDGQGNVEYERFITAILPPASSNVAELPEILGRLALFLSERKVSLKPLLARARRVTVVDLIATLRKLSFDIDAREQLVFKRAFGSDPINIDEFCDPIDFVAPPPIEPELEVLEPRARTIPPAGVVTILGKLIAVEKKTGIDFENEFRGLDQFRKGQVAVSHLRSVLLDRSTGLSAAEVDQLVAHYAVSPQQVNYVLLLADRGDYAEESVSSPTQTVEQLVARLKGFFVAQRISCQDLFRKHDRMGRGTIFAVRLRSVLESVGFTISEDDEQVLREAFKDDKSSDVFDYQKLSAAIAPAEEKQIQDRDLLILILSLQDRIRARRRRVRDAFPDSLGPTISEQEFREAIGSFGLFIRELELQRLLRYYRAKAQRDVDWKRFVLDVETTRVPLA
jgi:Ca2+-binding EF-hand superfamily protein